MKGITIIIISFISIGLAMIVCTGYQINGLVDPATLASSSAGQTNGTSGEAQNIIEWEAGDLAFYENYGEVEITLTVGSIQEEDVSIPFTLGGSAITPDDYDLEEGTLTIPAGEISVTVTFSIVDDAIEEGKETIKLELGEPSLTSLVLGANDTLTIQLVDNDGAEIGIEIGFQDSDSNASESAGTIAIPVILNAASGDTITVDYAVSGGDAVGSGTDYTLSDGTLTFNPGDVLKSIEVELADNTDTDGNKTLEITLSNPTESILKEEVHTLTITDDESTSTAEGTIEFATTTSEVDETTATTEIEVTLTPSMTENVIVNVSAKGGESTATPGPGNPSQIDATIETNQITFAPGETSKNVRISIEDDTKAEDDEVLMIELTNPSVNAALGTKVEHSLTILDND